MARTKKEVGPYCNPLCRSRMNGICIKTPAIGLVSSKIYHLTDSKDPSSGKYLEKSPIKTTPPTYCPFPIGKSLDRKADEDEPPEKPRKPRPIDLSKIATRGLTSPEGVVATSISLGFASYLGAKEVVNYLSSQTPDLYRLASDFYDLLTRV